jgi:hypothetical protein
MPEVEQGLERQLTLQTVALVLVDLAVVETLKQQQKARKTVLRTLAVAAEAAALSAETALTVSLLFATLCQTLTRSPLP